MLRLSSSPYSPECLEEEFCELRLVIMHRNSAAELAEVPASSRCATMCAHHPRCVGSARSLHNTIPYPAHRDPIHPSAWKGCSRKLEGSAEPLEYPRHLLLVVGSKRGGSHVTQRAYL